MNLSNKKLVLNNIADNAFIIFCASHCKWGYGQTCSSCVIKKRNLINFVKKIINKYNETH